LGQGVESKLPTTIDKHVGRRVKWRRGQLDMSQETLAEKLGVTFQQLQKYEGGTNRISAGRLYDLAVALETTIPYFFEGAQLASRVLRGVAEERDGFDAGTDADAVELRMVYRSIDDLAARKSVLAMARELARNSKRPAKKPKKRGR
jgi:transcriptional regulator with XRE-family HTH domain